MKFLRKNKYLIALISLIIIYFTYSITITFDSAHYLTYVNIIDGLSPISSWDIVRGPVFPMIIYLGNTVFGETIFGLQFLTFVFYLMFVYCTNYLLNNIFINNKNSKIKLLKNILLVICVLNPIIFGYFHTLLTEFVAITLSVFMIMISYKYIYCDWKSQKIKSIIFIFIFMVATVFSWHLKQPYILLVVSPLLIASIIAILKVRKIKNILFRLSTIAICFVSLICSIEIWNNFMINHGVNMNTGRDSNSLLSNGILKSLSFVDYVELDSEQIKKTDLLSKENKEKINTFDEDFQIIAIYDENEIIEYDLLETSNGKISTLSSISYIFDLFHNYPDLLLSNYLENYCAVSGLCVIETEDGTGYNTTNYLDGLNLYENNIIGYRIYGEINNNFPLNDHLNLYASKYFVQNNPPIYNNIFECMQIPANIMYYVTILGAPLLFIMLFIVNSFNIKRSSYVGKKTSYLSYLLLGTSTIYMLFTIVTNLIIDRYSLPIFVVGILGIISFTNYIIDSIKHRKFYRNGDVHDDNSK